MNAHRTETIDQSRILKAAASIGVLGGSVSQLMAALCNPSVTAGQVVSLVRKEPALYARILRVANSPYYGQARQINSVERALVLLGLDAVRGIAAAACLDRTMRRVKDPTLDVSKLVQHSVATAVAADGLARIRHPEIASDAFIAGLLHNLGTIAQASLDPDGVIAMIAQRESNDMREIRQLESEVAAIGHEECVAAILRAWGMPDTLVGAACHHHDPLGADTSSRPLASLVNLAARMGLATGNTFSLEPGPGLINADAMTCLGVDLQEFDELARQLPARVVEFRRAVFG